MVVMMIMTLKKIREAMLGLASRIIDELKNKVKQHLKAIELLGGPWIAIGD